MAQFAVDDTLCEDISLSKVLCLAMLNAGKEAIDNKPKNEKELNSFLKDSFKKNVLGSPEVLNAQILQSSIIKAITDNSPIDIEFKMIDRENAESVLGLEFSYSKEFSKRYLSASKTMNRYYSWDINVNGTMTQNALENPRNFIEAKVSFLGGMYTSIPMQPQDIIDTVNAMNNGECVVDVACLQRFTALIDGRLVAEQIKGFTYLKYGLKGGYESDQRFDAQNKTIGGFAFASYDAYDNTSFMGSLGIQPSARIALDEVDPSGKTPRVLAGDESTYQRFSGEVSVSMPIGSVLNEDMTLGFNYRIYHEISASDIVKNAGLERYHLRTFSLSSNQGLFVTYSSGRLPFDQQSESVVEIGWKTFF
jgi:hypothetical protein